MIIVEQSWALTSDDWQWPGPDPDWCRGRVEPASPPDTAASPAQSVLRGRVEDTNDAQVQLTSTHQDEQIPTDEILDYMNKDELSMIYIQMDNCQVVESASLACRPIYKTPKLWLSRGSITLLISCLTESRRIVKATYMMNYSVCKMKNKYNRYLHLQNSFVHCESRS